MVVREDHRRGVSRERRPRDLARVDRRLLERAAHGFLGHDPPMLAVEEPPDGNLDATGREGEPRVLADFVVRGRRIEGRSRSHAKRVRLRRPLFALRPMADPSPATAPLTRAVLGVAGGLAAYTAAVLARAEVGSGSTGR